MRSLTFVYFIFIPFSIKLSFLGGTSGEFDVNFTLQNIWGRLPQTGLRSLIQCISTDGTQNKIKFSRTLDTGQGAKLPVYSQQFLQGHPLFARILLMPSKDDLNRFGVFQCKIVKQNIASTIITLKLAPLHLAELDAVKPYHVASLGEDISLEVKVLKPLELPIIWRHNGNLIESWNDQLKVQLHNVQPIHSGIYECFYEGRRNESVHALMRVIVRSCPSSFYGDKCDLICFPCYNGGICHDKWGLCVCPAGFAGENCEIACGGNRFGAECDKICTPPQDENNIDEGCAFHLFCKSDPYGCSCAPGFKGIKCMDHCEPGWYGADCKQKCHCAYGMSSCNRITGACEGGCSKGWRGDSCHIEDPNADYSIETTTMVYCPVGNFGPSCEKRCRCAYNEACDVVSGYCSTGCEEGWSGSTCEVCITGRFGEHCEFYCHCEGGHHNCDGDGYCYSGCIAGWAGFTCQQECTLGRFGANCASACHCLNISSCDKVNGTCEGDCEAGYMGPDCQILCPQNKYGVNCISNCICQNEGRCNRIDGSCSCEHRWRGFSCNESEPQILAAAEEDVNKGQPVFISCTADAVPEPEMNISCGGFEGSSFHIRSLDQNQYQAIAKLKPQISGIFECVCSAMNQHGFDIKTMVLSVFEPPQLKQVPHLVEKSNTSLKIRWIEWKFSRDFGGKLGDTIEYMVMYKQNNSKLWEKATNWINDLEAEVLNLQSNTAYEISIKCRRPGKGGEGNMSPAIFVETTCGTATQNAIPQKFVPEKISHTGVVLTWEHPSEVFLRCSLLGYYLIYYPEGSENKSKSLKFKELTNTAELKNLTPGTSYIVQLYPMTILQTSEYFAELVILTPELASIAVENLRYRILENPDMLSITWEKPSSNDEITTGYVINYFLMDLGQCGISWNDDDTFGMKRLYSDKTEIILHNVRANSIYNISIAPETFEGESESASLIAISPQSSPSVAPSNVRVVSVRSRSLKFEWEPIPCLMANGDITFYECILVTSDKKLSMNISFTGESESEAFLKKVVGWEVNFENLVPYVKYGFSVRGRTNIGAGPFSDVAFHRTAEDVPAAPREVFIISVSIFEIQLCWFKPLPANGEVIHYRVRIWSHKMSELAADVILNATHDDENKMKQTFENLTANTDYFIKVQAATAVGWGNWSSPITGRTLLKDTSLTIKIEEKEVTNETMVIRFSRKGTSSVYKYQVIVEDSRNEESIDEKLLNDYENAVVKNNRPYYIAAELDPEMLSGTEEFSFTIGDQKKWGDYENVHLNPGHHYRIRLRVLIKKEQELIWFLSQPCHHSTDKSISYKISGLTIKILDFEFIEFILIFIGSVVFIMIIVFLAILSIYYTRRRKKSVNSICTRDSRLSETWSVMYKMPNRAT